MPRPEAARPLPPEEEEKYVYEPKEKKFTVIRGGKEVPAPRPEEEAPIEIIGSEEERKKLFHDALQAWSEGKMSYRDFKARNKEINRAQVAEIKELTPVTPKQYAELQDEIRAQYKDVDECARKLAELDEMTVVEGEEEVPKGTRLAEREEALLDIKSIAKKIEEGRKKETLTLATALEETGRLLREGKISALDANEIVASAMASNMAAELRRGKKSLLQGEIAVGFYKEQAKLVREAVERRKSELVKQATERMNKRIDMAKAEGRVDFGSHDLHEAFRIQRDASEEIKKRYGIDMQKPGLWGRIKILKERVINPAEFRVHYEPYKKYSKEYGRMRDQIAEKAPEVLSGKIFEELQEAGIMRVVEVPKEAPRARPEIQAVRDAVESGKITPEQGIKMIEVTRKQLEKATTDIKEIQGNIRIIDELQEQKLLTFSGGDYWTAYAKMKSLEEDLRLKTLFDPNANFLTNFVRAVSSGTKLEEYRTMLAQYNAAKKEFDQLETEFTEALPKIDKAGFWKKYYAERKKAA